MEGIIVVAGALIVLFWLADRFSPAQASAAALGVLLVSREPDKSDIIGSLAEAYERVLAAENRQAMAESRAAAAEAAARQLREKARDLRADRDEWASVCRAVMRRELRSDRERRRLVDALVAAQGIMRAIFAPIEERPEDLAERIADLLDVQDTEQRARIAMAVWQAAETAMGGNVAEA